MPITRPTRTCWKGNGSCPEKSAGPVITASGPAYCNLSFPVHPDLSDERGIPRNPFPCKSIGFNILFLRRYVGVSGFWLFRLVYFNLVSLRAFYSQLPSPRSLKCHTKSGGHRKPGCQTGQLPDGNRPDRDSQSFI